MTPAEAAKPTQSKIMDTTTRPTELAAVPCSGPPGFGWVVRGHPQWEDWHAWNDRILVRTGDGFFVVYVPEDGFPEYEHLDELADPDEWEAWTAIPRVQNAQDQTREPKTSPCSAWFSSIKPLRDADLTKPDDSLSHEEGAK